MLKSDIVDMVVQQYGHTVTKMNGNIFVILNWDNALQKYIPLNDILELMFVHNMNRDDVFNMLDKQKDKYRDEYVSRLREIKESIIEKKK